jgi:phage gpG-like protein
MMEDDLQRVSDAIEAISSTLKPAERKRLTTRIARVVRDEQANNIRRQRQPDGSQFTPRKPQKARREIKFIYVTSDGTGHLRSWRETDHYIIGFDRYRGAIRTFLKKRIVRTLKVDRGEVPSMIDRRRADSRRKMFNKTHKSKWLKARGTPDAATVEFAGAAERVARVHHYGLRDRVNKRGAEADYPERRLLGINQRVIALAEDAAIEHIAKKM